MIGEVIFMSAMLVVAGAIIWRSVKKKKNPKGTGKSCCE